MRWVCLVAALWLTAFARDRFDHWIDATKVPALAHVTSSEVRDRHGLLLRAYTVEDGRWRMQVSAEQIDPLFFRMLLAYEDKRFYRHAGVDMWATGRAGLQALRHGRVVSGASTLTMQVARLLEDSGTGAWRGKLRQMRVAWALERRLSKAQILDQYLMLAPYGGNVEGLRAASLIWLGKEPGRLTPAEAALLVALPQAPESRRPDRHAQAARIARDRVLLRMADEGVIAHDFALASLRDPTPDRRQPAPTLAPHLTDRAVAGSQGRHDLTLDAGLQRQIETLAQRHMTGRDAHLSIAIVLADYRSGDILASVGSRAYVENQGDGFVDMTQAKRSPGSTLKPLVYGLAFDAGLAHPETRILDAPVLFGAYAPQNFDGRFRGEVSMRSALQASLNIPVVRLTEALGPAHVMSALAKAGTQPELSGGAPGLAISLGGLGLTLEEMVSLYAGLANGGQAQALRWRKGIASATGQRMMSAASAWMVGDILSDIPPPPSAGPPGHVAYKTGTSYGHRDTWALGWDGQHVAGVWIGRPDGTPVPGAFGAALAAPVLFETLGLARQGDAPLPPPPAETLILPHGLLPPNLQRFGPAARHKALELTFPPDGSVLAVEAEGIPVKLRGGEPPYTVLADGAIVASQLFETQFVAPVIGAGFTTLTVLDGSGGVAKVRLELR